MKEIDKVKPHAEACIRHAEAVAAYEDADQYGRMWFRKYVDAMNTNLAEPYLQEVKRHEPIIGARKAAVLATAKVVDLTRPTEPVPE